MTRVVLLPSAYPPHLGGVEELSRHLALALAAAGDQVEVWTQQSDEVGNVTSEVMDGLLVRRFPLPLPATQVSSLPNLVRAGGPSLVEMVRTVRRLKPDVLHVQCFGPNGAYATAVSALTGVPLVISLQGETVMDDQDIFDTSTTLRSALRLGIKRAAAVTGCSQFTLDDAIERFGLPRAKGQVIFNGVSLADQPEAGAVPDAVGSGRYVFAVGRVVEKKGFDLLIRAFAQVAGRHHDVALVIGGAGSSLESLRALGADLGLGDRLRLPGRLAREQVAAAMAGAEIFVMPSRLEPFGIVTLEGWRAGRAVIASARGGAPEYVEDGKTGLIADPFDTPALAAALDRLLSDPELGARLGAAAIEAVKHFDWPVIAGQYQDCYARVRKS
jgi:glycogen(starch) synthase